ncbi:hypothetical protein D1AOALGA4SA_7084 [Olavius algarvensis Delta 1 endosymbiont]|nr:hypothetical protein D1AOALGA4SA_7084 [Olavius algarvensis Delta 1 endosymbiont]
MKNDKGRMVESLQASSRGTAGLRPDTSLSRFKIDRKHYSMFDVGRSLVSFSI